MSELLRPPVMSPGLIQTPLVDVRTGLITREWVQYLSQLRLAVASMYHPTLPPYMLTNIDIDRTFDANATNVKEIADVLATLIQDLKTIAGF